jgi:hypothetical protein
MHIQSLVNCPIKTDRSSFLSPVDEDEVCGAVCPPRSDLDPAGVSPGRPKQRGRRAWRIHKPRPRKPGGSANFVNSQVEDERTVFAWAIWQLRIELCKIENIVLSWLHTAFVILDLNQYPLQNSQNINKLSLYFDWVQQRGWRRDFISTASSRLSKLCHEDWTVIIDFSIVSSPLGVASPWPKMLFSVMLNTFTRFHPVSYWWMTAQTSWFGTWSGHRQLKCFFSQSCFSVKRQCELIMQVQSAEAEVRLSANLSCPTCRSSELVRIQFFLCLVGPQNVRCHGIGIFFVLLTNSACNFHKFFFFGDMGWFCDTALEGGWISSVNINLSAVF